jgi:hypothetical protein
LIETFSREDIEMTKLSQGGPALHYLHPATTAEVSRVILENVCRFLLKNPKFQKTATSSLLLSILIKTFKLRQHNEIYHLSLEILRSYPDHDLSLEALESLLLLCGKKNASCEVKIDAIKTCLRCLEKGTAKVGVNLLLTVSNLVNKKGSEVLKITEDLRKSFKTMFNLVNCEEKSVILKKYEGKSIRRSTVFQKPRKTENLKISDFKNEPTSRRNNPTNSRT